MSRLRHRFATSESDKEIQVRLETASQQVVEALRAARYSKSSRLRKRRVERDLGRVLAALDQVSSLESRYSEPEIEVRVKPEPKGKGVSDVG